MRCALVRVTPAASAISASLRAPGESASSTRSARVTAPSDRAPSDAGPAERSWAATHSPPSRGQSWLTTVGGHRTVRFIPSERCCLRMNDEYDVVVLGEPMVERHRTADGIPTAADSVSGDAFNAACAAALAGARVAMLTVLGTDPAGDLVLDELARRGVDPSLVRRAGQPTGAYTVTPDEQGQPRFSYRRAGSAASTLAPAL